MFKCLLNVNFFVRNLTQNATPGITSNDSLLGRIQQLLDMKRKGLYYIIASLDNQPITVLLEQAIKNNRCRYVIWVKKRVMENTVCLPVTAPLLNSHFTFCKPHFRIREATREDVPSIVKMIKVRTAQLHFVHLKIYK